MTRESCAAFCTNQGFPYSGTEYAQECYCSATMPTTQAWWCNMPCKGNALETCGSGGAMSVFYQAKITNAASYATSDMGCYGDASAERTFTGPAYVSTTNMTTENCANFCLGQGFPYSGTEYGQECYCSATAPWSNPVSCNMGCTGNKLENCGDGNALHVIFMNNGTKTASAIAPVSSAVNSTLSTLNSTRILQGVSLPQTFSSWSTFKGIGVNLGNWLILERWMDTTWFDNQAPGAQDEWTFCQQLGKVNCSNVLQQHWASWVTESDIATMASISVNTLRIPIGFWAFIDPDSTEPYVRSTQLQHVSRVLGYAAKYGMTVILDLHGLPGSQNGKDHSGHIGDVNWMTDANQQRLAQTVTAAAKWVAANGQGVISTIEVANEPALDGWAGWLAYKDIVVAAKQIIDANAPGTTTMFHDGFMPWDAWNHYFPKGSNVVIDAHNYWAFAPVTTSDAISQVCAIIDKFANLNMPVFVGEFSLSVMTAQNTPQSWLAAFFESQMQSWLQSAGGAFWSLRVNNADGVSQNPAWSALGVVQAGLLNQPNFWNLTEGLCGSMTV
ncbi:Glucan 1,3-beta-glucosidase 3 [Savitreella phatthalungensis]